jgi:hypothetical protein
MPSAITLQNTMNWSKAFLEQQPLQVNGLEPALSSANLVLQTVLNPPFAWPWNRSTLSFSATTQDTVISGMGTFGYLEGGSVQPAGGKKWEFQIKNYLGQDATEGRAAYCSPLIDDGAGNITFRLTPAPDQPYTANLIFQRRAPQMVAPGSSWAPVPDEKNYMCQWGFLALMSLIGNDSRFGEYNAKFVTAVLSAHGGLNEMERNIFLGNWIRVASQLQGAQLGVSERYKAREQ